MFSTLKTAAKENKSYMTCKTLFITRAIKLSFSLITIEGIRCIGDQLHVGIVLDDGEDGLKLFVMTMR